MKIFHSTNPYHFISEFKEPRLLNFAGEGGGKGAGGQQDGADEPDPNSPAGKKWAALRERTRIAEETAKAEREKAIAAEARANAFEDFKKSFEPDAKKNAATGGEAPVEGQDVVVNPDDEKVIGAVFARHIKKMGLDKIPGVVEALQMNTQQSQIQYAVTQAKAELASEFEGSVPFNFDESLKYAKEKGFGMVASTVKDALRMAHKEMNEPAFIEFYKGGAQPKKKVPKMAASGRKSADDEIINLDVDGEQEITSFEDSRALAHKLVADNEAQ